MYKSDKELIVGAEESQQPLLLFTLLEEDLQLLQARQQLLFERKWRIPCCPPHRLRCRDESPATIACHNKSLQVEVSRWEGKACSQWATRCTILSSARAVPSPLTRGRNSICKHSSSTT